MNAIRTLPEAVALEEGDQGEILTGACGSLIVVDGESRFVRLVQYTAKQYIERVHHVHLPNTRLEITKISLAYLNLSNFVDGV